MRQLKGFGIYSKESNTKDAGVGNNTQTEILPGAGIIQSREDGTGKAVIASPRGGIIAVNITIDSEQEKKASS